MSIYWDHETRKTMLLFVLVTVPAEANSDTMIWTWRVYFLVKETLVQGQVSGTQKECRQYKGT